MSVESGIKEIKKILAHLGSTALLAAAPMLPMNSGELNGGGTVCPEPAAPHQLRIYPLFLEQPFNPNNPYEPVRFLWEDSNKGLNKYRFILTEIQDTQGNSGPNLLELQLPRTGVDIYLKTPRPSGQAYWRYTVAVENWCGSISSPTESYLGYAVNTNETNPTPPPTGVSSTNINRF